MGIKSFIFYKEEGIVKLTLEIARILGSPAVLIGSIGKQFSISIKQDERFWSLFRSILESIKSPEENYSYENNEN